jgi:hypothetical protein
LFPEKKDLLSLGGSFRFMPPVVFVLTSARLSSPVNEVSNFANRFRLNSSLDKQVGDDPENGIVV